MSIKVSSNEMLAVSILHAVKCWAWKEHAVTISNQTILHPQVCPHDAHIDIVHII